MQRTCQVCGGANERPRSDVCSERCKKRRQRARRSGTTTPPVGLVDLPEPTSGDLGDSVEQELRDAGRLETPLGRAALDLARRLDANHRAPLQQAAAAHRELRAAIAEAMKGANAPKSALQAHRDDLAARRAAKAQ